MNSTIIHFENKGLFEFNQIAHSWNLDFIQLSPGVLSTNLTQIVTSEVQLGYAHFNCAVRQEGFSPTGMWTFAFTNKVKTFWRNFVVKPESIIIYAPGSEINAVSDPDFEVYTFSISEKFLGNWARTNNCLDVINQLSQTQLLETKGNHRQELRVTISDAIVSASKDGSYAVEQFKVNEFLGNLCSLLRQSTFSKDKVNSQQRLEVLKKAEGIMEQNFAEPPSVIELAAMLDISERTLLYIFNQRFNVGPKAFMKILKLNRAYHALRANLNSTIALIARQNGFWHLGQFSKDYKAFFEELPSETMRKATVN